MNTIQAYAHQTHKLARELAKIAVRALYFEVKAYPKPGLVSFVDNGAHQDMNGMHFYKSLFTLRHYFYDLVIADLSGANYSQLKTIGMTAERRMLLATGGVNTHRGAIFALGLMVISASRVVIKNAYFTICDYQKQLKHDWQNITTYHQSDANRHGEHVRLQYKIDGAKSMAQQGYSILFESQFVSFLDTYHSTRSLDICALDVYIYLMLRINDTNILYRKGKSGLMHAKQQVKQLSKTICVVTRKQQAIALHHHFSKENISPGGVGDLISAFFFAAQLFSELLRCHN